MLANIHLALFPLFFFESTNIIFITAKDPKMAVVEYERKGDVVVITMDDGKMNRSGSTCSEHFRFTSSYGICLQQF